MGTYFKPSFATANAIFVGIIIVFQPFTSATLLSDRCQIGNVFRFPISELVLQSIVESFQTTDIIWVILSVFPSIPKFSKSNEVLTCCARLTTPKIVSVHFNQKLTFDRSIWEFLQNPMLSSKDPLTLVGSIFERQNSFFRIQIVLHNLLSGYLSWPHADSKEKQSSLWDSKNVDEKRLQVKYTVRTEDIRPKDWKYAVFLQKIYGPLT